MVTVKQLRAKLEKLVASKLKTKEMLDDINKQITEVKAALTEARSAERSRIMAGGKRTDR